MRADPEDLRLLQESIEEMDTNQQVEESDDLIIDNDCEESYITFEPAPWCGQVMNHKYLNKYGRLIDQSPFYRALA